MLTNVSRSSGRYLKMRNENVVKRFSGNNKSRLGIRGKILQIITTMEL